MDNILKDKKIVRAIFMIVIFLPFVIGLALVYHFGVNVIHWDEWDMVSFLKKFQEGNITLKDFFAQHNEHRIMFPKLVIVLLSLFTKYNTVIQMYFIQLLLLCVLLVFLFAFMRLIDFKKYYFTFIPVSFLVFSYNQAENMLWGFQIGFVMTDLFVILAGYYLYSFNFHKVAIKKYISYLLALICATIASFSSSMGLLIWIIGFIALTFLYIKNKIGCKSLIVWTITGILEWLAYFYHYIKPAQHPDIYMILKKPFTFLEYLLAATGGALFGNLDLAIVVGAIIFLIAITTLILIFKYKCANENLFWIMITLFGVFTVGSISVGRLGFGVEQALSSRYSTFSILIPAALYVILLELSINKKSNTAKILLQSLIVIIIISIPMSYISGIRQGVATKVSRQRIASILRNYDTEPNEALINLYPDAEPVKIYAPFLKEHKYSVFSDNNKVDLSGLTPATNEIALKFFRGSVEVGNEGKPNSYLLFIGGWAVDDNVKNVVKSVYIDIDGKLYDSFYGVERKDVATNFNVPKYVYSGFERYIPASVLGLGKHTVTYKAVTIDGNHYYVAPDKVTIEVTNSAIKVTY